MAPNSIDSKAMIVVAAASAATAYLLAKRKYETQTTDAEAAAVTFDDDDDEQTPPQKGRRGRRSSVVQNWVNPDLRPSLRREPTARFTEAWYEDDIVVTLVPKFKIKEGMRDAFVELIPKFVELVKAHEAERCIHYGFVGPTEDDYIICREGYVAAKGVLDHLDNCGGVLNEALKYADIVDLMVQGPAEELEKLKGPLADLNPKYYPLAAGSLRNKKGW